LVTSASSPPARYSGGIAFDSGRSVTVLHGGGTLSSTSLSDTWEYNGTSWTQRSPPVSPSPAREFPAMAYDALRGKTLLFGGRPGTGSTSLNDTWQYDGTTWTHLFPVTAPPTRQGAVMVWDATRQVLVMFGGYDAGSVFRNDTWEWNGTDWLARTPATTPTGLAFLGAAYDSARQRTVIFGGERTTSTSVNELWEYNGTTWAAVPVSGTWPPATQGPAIAYDAAGGRTFMIGGYASTYLTTVWGWDGAAWTSLAQPSTTPRGYAMAAYDSSRQRIVLFGGYNSTSSQLGDTWEY
jgi:hypothetical protein